MSKIAVKRLNKEMKDLRTKDKSDIFQIIQDEDNLFDFYFLIIGDSDSDYKGGYYIGKILLTDKYPFSPPDFMMLTPSGRFEINKKICLSNTGYHSEEWSPNWKLCTMLMGLISIFTSDADSGISHIHESSHDRKIKAELSCEYNRINLFNIFTRFDQFINEDGTIKKVNEQITNEDIKNDKMNHDVKHENKHEMKCDKNNYNDYNDDNDDYKIAESKFDNNIKTILSMDLKKNNENDFYKLCDEIDFKK